MPVVDENDALIGIVMLDNLLEIVAEEMDKMAKLISREQLREDRSRKLWASANQTEKLPDTISRRYQRGI